MATAVDVATHYHSHGALAGAAVVAAAVAKTNVAVVVAVASAVATKAAVAKAAVANTPEAADHCAVVAGGEIACPSSASWWPPHKMGGEGRGGRHLARTGSHLHPAAKQTPPRLSLVLARFSLLQSHESQANVKA